MYALTIYPSLDTGRLLAMLLNCNVAELRRMRLRRPEHGLIARRRVQDQDARRDLYISRCFANFQIDNPQEQMPVWKEIKWIDSPHPGTKVSISEAAEASPKSAERLQQEVGYARHMRAAACGPWQQPLFGWTRRRGNRTTDERAVTGSSRKRCSEHCIIQ